jgi:hypothetical protein
MTGKKKKKTSESQNLSEHSRHAPRTGCRHARPAKSEMFFDASLVDPQRTQ